MLRSPLKSFAVFSLVSSWLLASIAPGILNHLSVGSRFLAVASTHSDEVAAVALAIIRGELCGLATEIEKAEKEQPETPTATQAPTVKVILGLVDCRTEISVASSQERTAIGFCGARSLDRAAPPGPPPRVI